MKSVATISVRIAAAAALSALALMPGTAGAESIKEAAEAAVGTHPEVGQLRFSRRAIEQELRATRGGYLPQIDVRGAAGHESVDNNATRTRPGRTNGENGWVDINRYEAGVSPRQLPFDGFGTDSEANRQFFRVESSRGTDRGSVTMATDKDRPGDTGSVERTEAFDLAAIKDGGEGRVEIAQTGATPIEVPRPGAGQTLTISVVAGRPLKLAFNAGDVKSREVVKDDLVLEFDNGGKIVLKEYMTAFGMLGEVRTTIIQPDGKHYAFTELLSPTAGPRKTERPAPGTQGDVVIIQKPPAGEKQTFKLTDEKPMALNFGFGQIAKRQVDKDGNLVLTFKDGAVLILDGYSALKDNKSIGLYFAKGDKIALADLAPGAGPEDPGAEGGPPPGLRDSPNSATARK